MLLKPLLVFIFASVSATIRWFVTLNDYSGMASPPMYGDYEAQRHWQEITVNLDLKNWYENTTDNDLQYWGLDYPPLTAYHSWMIGQVAKRINSSWVELHKSRGMESYDHKVFMRVTVWLSDCLVFIPAVLLYYLKETVGTEQQRLSGMILTLFSPGLIVIDHGHFQYNCVSLGLALLGIIGVTRDYLFIGSAAFVAALNYKQMELYHALPFFFFLLGKCCSGWHIKVVRLLKLSMVVLLCSLIIWFPFLQYPGAARQVVKRLFPIDRGIFEDKVANVWCTLSLFIKLKLVLSQASLLKLCLGATLVGLIPSSVHLFMRPTVANFRIALINSSLTFFLFSYQVHEKSILLATLPACLTNDLSPFASMWFSVISTFSMFPLFVKDNCALPAIVLTVMFVILYWESYDAASDAPVSGVDSDKWVLFTISNIGAGFLCLCVVFLGPPARYPDLWPVLISAYSAVHFVFFWAYFHWLQFTVSDAENLKKVK